MQYDQQTGLQYAAEECWPLICSELIDRGADVMATDEVILMFWMISMLSNQESSMFSCLITAKDGNTPLHLAAGADIAEARARGPDTIYALLGIRCKATRQGNGAPQPTISMLDAQLLC